MNATVGKPTSSTAPRQGAEEFRDVSALVNASAAAVADLLQQSPVWERMSDGTLPFLGRAAYLEQHWEGLSIVLDAVRAVAKHTPPGAAGRTPELQIALEEAAASLSTTLDRIHGTGKWSAHHVTMPSIHQLRRRMQQCVADKDLVPIAAHAVVRLAAARACPANVPLAEIPPVTVVADEEAEELFAEDLSAATVMVLDQGADVCRAYPESAVDKSCAMTVAAIRRAFSQ